MVLSCNVALMHTVLDIIMNSRQPSCSHLTCFQQRGERPCCVSQRGAAPRATHIVGLGWKGLEVWAGAFGIELGTYIPTVVS